MIAFSISSILMLLTIAWFDFKDRSIPVVLLIAESLVCSIYFYLAGLHYYFTNVGINMGMMIVQFGMMISWFKIRKPGSKIFNQLFGWGDVWLIAIAALFFMPVTYLIFIIGVAVLSLAYALVVRLRQGIEYKSTLIPLAGIAALALAIIQAVYLSDIDLYNKELINIYAIAI